MMFILCDPFLNPSRGNNGRMGTREHEGWVRRASATTVDLIQSTNVVKVAADEGYGSLVAALQGPKSRQAQLEYEAALGNVRGSGEGHASPADDTIGQPALLTKPLEAIPQQPPHLADIAEHLQRGDCVLVPRSVWPTYECAEHAGLGWAATVVSATKHTAVLHFKYARAENGARFSDERLATHVLKRIL